MQESQKTETSKFLSFVLRHKPEAIGLELSEQGWARVPELLQKMKRQKHAVTMAELEEVVATNPKKRFAFNEDHSLIRASQGHSVAVDLALNAATPPLVLYHGTVEKFRSQILQSGLLKMSRQQVHLSADTQTADIVARRRGKPVILAVQSGAMHTAGYLFYISENGVWLTDAVPPAYLSVLS